MPVKRGRPRKAEFPTELLKLVDDVLKKEELEFHQIIEEVKQERKGEWDFKKEEHIKFFDINLSYELTGYKPINETCGLDFNPSWFTEARDTFLRTGHYTEFKENTKAYKEYWTELYIRCRDGMTVNGYTVTGPNYYYLNFYQLPNIEVSKAGSGRAAIFPNFLVFLYEFFHYFELCRVLKKDCVLMKARGIGQ